MMASRSVSFDGGKIRKKLYISVVLANVAGATSLENSTLYMLRNTALILLSPSRTETTGNSDVKAGKGFCNSFSIEPGKTFRSSCSVESDRGFCDSSFISPGQGFPITKRKTASGGQVGS